MGKVKLLGLDENREEYSYILRVFGKTQKPLTIEGRKIHQTTTEVRREYGCGDRHWVRRGTRGPWGPLCTVAWETGTRAEALLTTLRFTMCKLRLDYKKMP